jgi:ribosome-binding factor A
MQFKRSARVGDLIKREICSILMEDLKDPHLGFVTITKVVISDDLKEAKVFYSVLGDERDKRESQKTLVRARGFIQKLIGERLGLKFTPHLAFYFDSSIEYGAKIDEILKILEKEREDAGKKES